MDNRNGDYTTQSIFLVDLVDFCSPHVGMPRIVKFPRWAEVLAESGMASKQRESFKVTIRWYLGWCARNSVGCSVPSARDFIDWAAAEKRPNEWVLEQWKTAI